MYVDKFGMRPDNVYPVDVFGCEGVSRYDTIPESIYTKNEGLINGQEIFPYSKDAMGFGTYGKNGCGVIAVYNAMQLLGYRESLAKIEMELFIRGGYMLGGLLGISAQSIYSYFVDQGLSCEVYFSFDSLASNIQENSLVVFLVLNDQNTILSGAHYMTAQYTAGQYTVYNMYNNLSKPVIRNSLQQPYGNSVFLCGFIVGG